MSLAFLLKGEKVMDNEELMKMTNKEAAEILKNIVRPRPLVLGGRKNGITYDLNTRVVAMNKAIALLEKTPDESSKNKVNKKQEYILDEFFTTYANQAASRYGASDFSNYLHQLELLFADTNLSTGEKKHCRDNYMPLLYAHTAKNVALNSLSRDFDGDTPDINVQYFIRILKETFESWQYESLMHALRRNTPVYLYGVPHSGKTLILTTLKAAGFKITEAGQYNQGPNYIPEMDNLEQQPLILETYYQYRGPATMPLDFRPVASEIRKYILEVEEDNNAN